MYGILLHQISFTDSRMHIYQAPLLQLTIDLWNTTTTNMFNIYQNAHILRADGPPPIDHRCMEYHYTTISFTDSRMQMYQGPPPPIDHRCMEYHLHQISFTYSRMHIYLGQMYPLQLNHRSMEYRKLHQ